MIVGKTKNIWFKQVKIHRTPIVNPRAPFAEYRVLKEEDEVPHERFKNILVAIHT
jgi:hypothetical protein